MTLHEDEASQGGFEYLLLVGAAILLAVLVLTVARSSVFNPIMNSSTPNATSVKNQIRNVT